MAAPGEIPHKIAEGQWGKSTSWEFYLGNEVPDTRLCTAVYCLAIVSTNPEQVVLARNRRGWEMLGGHIEPGELLEEALMREAVEEGGFHPSRYEIFGYRKVIAHELVVNDHHGGHYPPVSYIPHFVGTTDRELTPPNGEDIFEAAVFETGTLPNLELSQALIAAAGLAVYRRHQVAKTVESPQQEGGTPSL